MKIIKTKFAGVFEIEIYPKTDDRGFFLRTFDNNIFENEGIDRLWVQENHSFTSKSGTIRGLHFQFHPFSETKLVRVSKGKILDVILDLRIGSETFGKWYSTELSRKNNKCLFIPKGFAHGFCTLVDNCDVLYKVDNFYSSEHEGGVIWDDSTLNINWPTKNPIISSKDKKLISFDEFVTKYEGLQRLGNYS